MPRSGKEARRRLQEAALELYLERGYDATTTAQIAERAGVTERTFFRHFTDKREVLFEGEPGLRDALVRAIAEAPEDSPPLAVLRGAFSAVLPVIEGNRSLLGPRAKVIAATPQLRERELAKVEALNHAMADALRERGLSESLALLAAKIGTAAFERAAREWRAHPSKDPHELLAESFDEIHALG